MNWVGLHVTCSEEIRDILLAELSQLPFETFEETETGLSAFGEEVSWNEDAVKEIMQRYNQEFTTEIIEKVNWNEEWEKNYDPIIVSDECVVRATFHEPSNTPFEIIIDPKMSFGTGHHSTTHLVLEYQLSLDHAGMKVMDVGCGTGVLAIMAMKKGASSVLAFDIEDWCVENSLENFSLNQCSGIEAKQITIEKVEDSEYDLILANITKGVHLDQMSDYASLLNKGGLLAMSGFYEKDVQDLVAAAKPYGLVFEETATRNDWARLICRKA